MRQLRGSGEAQECRQRLHEAITGLLLPPNPPSAGAAASAAVGPILELESPAALDALLLAQRGGQTPPSGQSQQQQPQPQPQPQQQPGKPVYQDRAALIQALMSSSFQQKQQQQQQQQQTAAAAAAPAAAAAHHLLLVEFYGQNCKQCKLVGPMFESLPFAYRGRPLAFARADVTRFPALVVPPPDPQAFAGLDRSADIDARLEGCPRCGGSGLVACEACGGKGHVVRTSASAEEGGPTYTVADVCGTCVGHKTVPCTQCGGKCYLC